MRLATLLLVVLALVPAGAAATVRTVTAAGPVVALAIDGRRIAFAEGTSTHDCDRVRVWNLSSRAVSKLGRSSVCVRTSTGTGISSVALAGTRALWLHYTGGNLREWRLYTATTTAPRPRLLTTIVRDVDAPAPIVLGDGSSSRFGEMLPYAADRTVIALRPNGSRRFAWRAPARVVALSATGGELAVASEGGLVTILDAAGKTLGSEQFSGEISAVKLTGDGVVVQRGRILELRAGAGPKTFTLPVRATLEDAVGSRAFFVTGGQVRQLLLTSGSQRMLALGSHVAVEQTSVAISTGRRVTARPLP